MKLSIAQAAAALARGEVVAVPTETVFGLAARLDVAGAVGRVFGLKGRAPALPCPVLVSGPGQAQLLLDDAPRGQVLQVMETFWPGALTLVLPGGRTDLPTGVLGAGGTVGVRQDGHPVLGALMAAVTFPVTGTSANLSGAPTMVAGVAVDAVFAGMPGYAGYIGDRAMGGRPSTVASVGNDIQILREGVVSAVEIAKVWGGDADER